MKKTIHLIAAARPNFMKIAPLYHALKNEAWANPVLIHTGQHYDLNMSDAFFQDLRLPAPDIHLAVGSGSHAEQTGQVMIAYEKILLEHKPDMVVVVGDVNSTIACALATAKISYPAGHVSSSGLHRPVIAHLEAGLRSFDLTMPEEVNRIATDVLSDLLWTPSPDGDENLLREGITPEKIIRVGNIMLDSFEMMRQNIESDETYKTMGLSPKTFGVVTLHRPANVDNPVILRSLCQMLTSVSKILPMVFPVHPRTRSNLVKHQLLDQLVNVKGLTLLEPLNYIRFMNLVKNCRLVVTDSGGIQEETTYLGVPCLTMRPNTERPITITEGTNQLCTLDSIESKVEEIMQSNSAAQRLPDLWDGQTAGRVVKSIRDILQIQ